MPQVRLSLPADVRYLRTLRLTAAGCADLAGLHEADIEDLRLAVEELSGILIAHSSRDLSISFLVGDGSVEVKADTPCNGHGHDPDVSQLAVTLLDVAVNSWELGRCDGMLTFRLLKVASRA